MNSGRPFEHAAEAAILGLDAGREVPRPLPRRHPRVEARGVHLGAGRAEQDLRGGGQRFVVEVAEPDHGALLALVLQQPSGVVAQGDRLGRAHAERVAGVAGAFALVERG